MKFVALLVLGVLIFAGTLVGIAAFKGNLNKESIERLVKKPEPAVVSTAPKEDDLGPLARALREREDKLDEREKQIRERETRVAQMTSDLEELRTEVTTIQKQIATALDTEETDRKERLSEVALSLAQMKPANAAETLQDWPVEDAAEVLLLIKEKDRGKILDGMDPAKAAVLLRALQERKY